MEARADRYWNRVTQTAPREVLDALHLRKIRHLIEWTYENSPMHRAIYDQARVAPRDIRTWDDYYRVLPFTDKADYLADQEKHDGIGGAALPRRYWQQYFHTTGTTGRFLGEVFTQYEMHKGGSQYCYSLWEFGIRPGDSMYLCFDWGMWVGLWSFYWAARNLGLLVISGGGVPGPERVRQILERRPTIVVGTPTYLLHLAEIADAEGVDLRQANVSLLAGGGESGMSIPVMRRRLSAAWRTEGMLDAYGIGELLHVAQSCRDSCEGVHVIEDACHSYSVDPETRLPIAERDAIGENVVTSYTHFAQPFIKYRTHDLVRRQRDPDHGCGWTWAYLPGVVLGRTDFMVTIRGVNVYPTAVESLIGEVPGLTNHYELHIHRVAGMDRMLVKAEARAGAPDCSALSRQLAEHVQRKLGVRLETEVVSNGTLPRYQVKSRHVIDHRAAEERASQRGNP